MKRLLRILPNLLGVIALAVVLLLWLRTLWVADVLNWQRWRNRGGTYEGRFTSVLSGRGVIGLSLTRLTTAFPATSSTAVQFKWQRHAPADFRMPTDTRLQKLGFGYVSHSEATQGLQNSTVTERAYWAPYWLLAIFASIAPMRWLVISIVRVRRRRKGRCARCGYDVRFSADRCPECGHRLPATSTQAVANDREARGP